MALAIGGGVMWGVMTGPAPGPGGRAWPMPATPLPWVFLLGLSAARLALHLLSSGPLAYGTMSDEYYYLDCAQRLDWGYVDHPPLSLALLRGVQTTLGDSLPALRLLPALAHCGTMVLVAALARELGGGRTACRLGALAVWVAPVYLGVSGFWSMNAFEPLFWAGAALLLARLANGAPPATWLGLGAVVGLGLLNKISVLWLGGGIALGILATPQRRWLLTPWPWAAAALAAALFAPHVVWQAEHDWPTLEFMQNAREQKLVAKSPLAFAGEQILVMSPLLAPLWLAGLVFYFASASGRRHRALAWIWIGTFVLLAATGSVRSAYLGPAYTVLLPAGAVAFERLARRRYGRWLPAGAAIAFAVSGAAMMPLAVALLPPADLVRYADALGIRPPAEQTGDAGELPLHMGLRFGWAELRAALREALATLTPEEREHAVVLGSWFGDTGMINHHRRRGEPFPPAISGHNSYALWGPGDATGQVVIALVDGDAERLHHRFRDVRAVAEVDCRFCVPELDRMVIYVCRDPRLPIAEWWPEERRYI